MGHRADRGLTNCAGGCGTELTGRQKKWCSDTECKRDAQRWAWVLKTYNLSREQYTAIWDAQGGLCPVTGRDLAAGATPHIDHDHVTGVVRGIVTAYANTRLIGRLRSHETAQALADYLREPPAVRALGCQVIAPGRPPKKRRRRK